MSQNYKEFIARVEVIIPQLKEHRQLSDTSELLREDVDVGLLSMEAIQAALSKSTESMAAIKAESQSLLAAIHLFEFLNTFSFSQALEILKKQGIIESEETPAGKSEVATQAPDDIETVLKVWVDALGLVDSDPNNNLKTACKQHFEKLQKFETFFGKLKEQCRLDESRDSWVSFTCTHILTILKGFIASESVDEVNSEMVLSLIFYCNTLNSSEGSDATHQISTIDTAKVLCRAIEEASYKNNFNLFDVFEVLKVVHREGLLVDELLQVKQTSEEFERARDGVAELAGTRNASALRSLSAQGEGVMPDSASAANQAHSFAPPIPWIGGFNIRRGPEAAKIEERLGINGQYITRSDGTQEWYSAPTVVSVEIPLLQTPSSELSPPRAS